MAASERDVKQEASGNHDLIISSEIFGKNISIQARNLLVRGEIHATGTLNIHVQNILANFGVISCEGSIVISTDTIKQNPMPLLWNQPYIAIGSKGVASESVIEWHHHKNVAKPNDSKVFGENISIRAGNFLTSGKIHAAETLVFLTSGKIHAAETLVFDENISIRAGNFLTSGKIHAAETLNIHVQNFRANSELISSCEGSLVIRNDNISIEPNAMPLLWSQPYIAIDSKGMAFENVIKCNDNKNAKKPKK